ncbi:MAG: hypothetical protein WDM71_05295 [Ferruginibacter sp.]
MRKLFLLLFLLKAFISFGQHCTDFKEGIFYAYQKNSSSQYSIERQGNTEKETDLKTQDSSLWKISWKSDCSYTLEYISGKITDDQAKFLKKHKLAFLIQTVEKDYYIYSAYVDKISGVLLGYDTLWIHPKSNYSGSLRYAVVEGDPDSLQIYDTSHYALVYIYRPWKIDDWLINFAVSFDGDLACGLKNSSAYIFAFFKEGPLTISSKTIGEKRHSDLHLNLKFGNKYFVKATPHLVAIACKCMGSGIGQC